MGNPYNPQCERFSSGEQAHFQVSRRRERKHLRGCRGLFDALLYVVDVVRQLQFQR
jgi:hypothetical protein